MPPAASFVSFGERTYVNFIGALEAKPNVTAECVFVDPASDLAVLGPPDSRKPHEKHHAYIASAEDIDRASTTAALSNGSVGLARGINRRG